MSSNTLPPPAQQNNYVSVPSQYSVSGSTPYNVPPAVQAKLMARRLATLKYTPKRIPKPRINESTDPFVLFRR